MKNSETLIIQRILMPKNRETYNLYTREFGNILSFNTYFNSFYTNTFIDYTTIKSAFWNIKITGKAKIVMYGERINHSISEKKIISETIVENNNESEIISIPISDIFWDKNNPYRIYLEIEFLSENGKFIEGFVGTHQKPEKKVRASVVIPTFKKEKEALRNIKTIFEDKMLDDIDIFVIDQGETFPIDEIKNPRIKVTKQENYGSSGGFSRGMMEVEKSNNYTHVILMDDDIKMESDSIWRTIVLHMYSKRELLTLSSMIDIDDPLNLKEQGHFVDYKSGNSYRRMNNYDIGSEKTLTYLISREDAYLAGFWIYCFNVSMIKKSGLLLPFFIVIDDVEYALRLKEENEINAVAHPGISVWHRSFEELPSGSNRSGAYYYYGYRNHNILKCKIGVSYYEQIKIIIIRAIHILRLLLSPKKNEKEIKIIYLSTKDYLLGPKLFDENYLEQKIRVDKYFNKSTFSKIEEIRENTPSLFKLIKLFINKKTRKFLLSLIIIVIKASIFLPIIKNRWKKYLSNFSTEKYWNKLFFNN